jgi:hypothetical protein
VASGTKASAQEHRDHERQSDEEFGRLSEHDALFSLFSETSDLAVRKIYPDISDLTPKLGRVLHLSTRDFRFEIRRRPASGHG